jgi:pantetheine-phosphate adenylyltransferase
MSEGLYAGSFDPITKGHIDIIRRAGMIVNRLHILVGHNPKKSGLFSIDRRVELIVGALEEVDYLGHTPETGIIVGQFKGLTVDACKQRNIQFIIRGLRAAQDFNAEFELHGIHYDLAPEINTIFLMAPPAFQFISSSRIKELAENKSQEIVKYVTKNVAKALAQMNGYEILA